MENFFYNEIFHSDLGELIDYLDYDEDNLPDDGTVIKIELSKLEKVITVTDDFIVDAVLRATDQFDDRFPEDSEDVMEQIGDAIKKVIDIDRLNGLLPELYYPSGKFIEVTKQDILDYIAI